MELFLTFRYYLRVNSLEVPVVHVLVVFGSLIGCLILSSIGSYLGNHEARRMERELQAERNRKDRQERLEFSRLPREAQREWHRNRRLSLGSAK